MKENNLKTNVNKKSVVMSNNLMAINWSKFKEQEIKVILNLISNINPEQSAFKDVIFDAREFREVMGISRNMSYKEMYELINSIMEKTIQVYGEWNADKNEYYRDTTHFIESLTEIAANDVQRGSGVKRLIFKFPEVLENHLLVARDMKISQDGKKEGIIPYKKFPAAYIENLNGPYTLKLFLFLMAKINFNGNGNINVHFEELKNVIGFVTKVAGDKTKKRSFEAENNGKRKHNKYSKSYYNFKLRTLIPMIEALNQHTFLNVDLEDFVSGDMININLKYSIDKNKIIDKNEELPLVEDKSANDNNLIDECNDIEELFEQDVDNKSSNKDVELENIKEIYKSETGRSMTEDSINITIDLLSKYSKDDIVSEIKKYKSKIKGMGYIVPILKDKYDSNGVKVDKKNKKNILLKDSNKSGDEMIKALEEQLGGPVDFNKIFN